MHCRTEIHSYKPTSPDGRHSEMQFRRAEVAKGTTRLRNQCLINTMSAADTDHDESMSVGQLTPEEEIRIAQSRLRQLRVPLYFRTADR